MPSDELMRYRTRNHHSNSFRLMHTQVFLSILLRDLNKVGLGSNSHLIVEESQDCVSGCFYKQIFLLLF